MSARLKIKDGLIDRLKETRRIPSDEAFARLCDSHRTTLDRIRDGAQPSGSFVAEFCAAFGLGLGEAFEVVVVSDLLRGSGPTKDLVYCETHNPRGAAPVAHAEKPQCVSPHAAGIAGAEPSMTEVETLDPRMAAA